MYPMYRSAKLTPALLAVFEFFFTEDLPNGDSLVDWSVRSVGGAAVGYQFFSAKKVGVASTKICVIL